MGKRKFKAESQQLLDLMIHSIYSNKEVFLRELLSNAADALHKRHIDDLQAGRSRDEELEIEIMVDEKERTLQIIDTGIGMSEEDVHQFLGTIAHSGTKAFMEQLQKTDEQVDAIGQFGVGFYSSFIVSDKVIVETKKNGHDAILWTSNGVDSYETTSSPKETIGTCITLHLREGEEFSEFTQLQVIEQLVKKYSNYIKFPIYMTKEVPVPQTDENEEAKTALERQVVNAQKALWKKKKSEVEENEYASFYKNKYFDFEDPIHHISAHLEGKIEYDVLLYIPAHKPFDYYSGSYEKGLDLYSKEILIEERASYLLPNYFNFIRGVVDCADINLNISREMLQKDNVVAQLTSGIESKIISELKKIQKKDRETYEKIFETFGRELTFGVYEDYGMHKDKLVDLLLYKSSKEEKYVTLSEYVERNTEQDSIYYVAGKEIEVLKKMPAMEPFLDKEIEVLFFTNDIDEFAISMLQEYKGKKFISITNADMKREEDSETLEEVSKNSENLLDILKKELEGEVKDVRLTTVLKTSAVRLMNEGNVSIEMEKTLSALPGNENVVSEKILELNIHHDVYKTLEKIQDEKILQRYARVLYEQSRLVEGLPLKDPMKYTEDVAELISQI